MQASFLPSDEQIYERSKVWSNFFSRIVEEEDYQDMGYDDIEDVFPNDEEKEEDSEVDEISENTPTNGCVALMKVEKFEASSSSSDDFDNENLLNETRNIIEERKRKWKESGMDRVLDTFDFNAITDKVGSWLRKTKHEIPSDVSMREVHYENHQYEMDSDDSFQSADTAKYILSNRKPRAGSCTKMIIKRFRYVKGKRKELQKKYNCLDENELEMGNVFSKNGGYSHVRTNRENACLNDYDECRTPTNHIRCNSGHRHIPPRQFETCNPKYIPCCDISGVMPLNYGCKTPKTRSKVNLESICKTTALVSERKHRSRFRKRRSDVGRRRSTSRSSSCSSDRRTSHARPRFRKFLKKPKKYEVIDLSLLSSSPDDAKQNHNAKQPSPPKAKCNLKSDPKKDVTCFLPENIVNSTAITNKKAVASAKSKTCQLSPVKATNAKKSDAANDQRASLNNNDKQELSKSKSNAEEPIQAPKRKESLDSRSSVDSKSSDKRIVLYNPENESLYNESITRGAFVLTEEYLKKSVGKKQAQRFIAFNEKKFPLKFDLSSTVYFMLPLESESSHRSGSSGESDDEDVLNMFGKQGSLVEQTSLSNKSNFV